MNKRSLHFIINPISGIKSKSNVVDKIKALLGADYQLSFAFTEKAEHATELAAMAIEQKVDAVVAVGGDGTINEVAKALIHTNVPLGVIPMGSGNGFARHMKIPLNLDNAINCVGELETQTIDTAEVNGEAFLSTVGIGFDALVGKKFADFGKRGLLSYMQVTTNEFFSFKADKYELVVDGKAIKTKAFLINFANVGQYGNNAWIAPEASVTDGKLNVCMLEQFPPHLAPDIIFKLFNKQIHRSKYYHSLLAEKVKVSAPHLFHLDGEPREYAEDLEINIQANSLKVIC